MGLPNGLLLNQRESDFNLAILYQSSEAWWHEEEKQGVFEEGILQPRLPEILI